jgi:NitT/TauT family transport system ATP-binding protein
MADQLKAGNVDVVEVLESFAGQLLAAGNRSIGDPLLSVGDRVLGGLTPCTSGSVRINGREITGPPDGVVIVFQDYSHALLQWRTVFRNAALGIEGRVRARELQRLVIDALTVVGLEKNATDYPWQLSGGMQQRLQIARALAVRPSALLMDEPFAALVP